MWHILAQQLAHSKCSVSTITMTKILMMMITNEVGKRKRKDAGPESARWWSAQLRY